MTKSVKEFGIRRGRDTLNLQGEQTAQCQRIFSVNKLNMYWRENIKEVFISKLTM